MNGNVLIKSKKNSLDLIVIALVIFGVLLSIALFVGYMISHTDYYEAVDAFVKSADHAHYNELGEAVFSQEECWFCDRIGDGTSKFSFLLSLTLDYFWGFIIPLVIALLAVVVFVWIGGYRLTVTSERVYGTAAWGKKVSFPVDTVTGAETCGLSGVAVSTAEGTTKFLLIKNADAVCAAINGLVGGEAAAPAVAEAPVAENAPVAAADPVAELKRYKELLDNGVITQEEFDAKKKQLLGL